VWGQAEFEGLDVSSSSGDDLISLGLSCELSERSVSTLVESSSKLVTKNELSLSPDSDGLGSSVVEEDGSPLLVGGGDLGNEGLGSLLLGREEHSHSSVSPVSDSEELHSEGSGGSLSSDTDASESELLLWLSLAVPPGQDSALSWLVVMWGQALGEGLNEKSLSSDDLISLGSEVEWSELNVLSNLGALTSLVGKGVGLQSVVSDGLGSSIEGEDGSPGL
jgi:hypothetical protein